jgi:hypothetical protein
MFNVEYKVVRIKWGAAELMSADLNLMARDGWRVVSQSSDRDELIYTFVRAIASTAL